MIVIAAAQALSDSKVAEIYRRLAGCDYYEFTTGHRGGPAQQSVYEAWIRTVLPTGTRG
jgi:hypothetical protein